MPSHVGSVFVPNLTDPSICPVNHHSPVPPDPPVPPPLHNPQQRAVQACFKHLDALFIIGMRQGTFGGSSRPEGNGVVTTVKQKGLVMEGNSWMVCSLVQNMLSGAFSSQQLFTTTELMLEAFDPDRSTVKPCLDHWAVRWILHFLVQHGLTNQPACIHCMVF